MSKDAKVGIISLIIIAITFYIITYFNVITPLKPARYKIYVLWDNINGLREGVSVMMKGVYVGEVGEVIFFNDKQKARVTLEIKPYDTIPEGSAFRILRGLIGEQWVSIEPGDGKPITDGMEVEGVSPFSTEDEFRLFTEQIGWYKKNASYVQEKTEAVNKIVGDEKFRKDVKERVMNIRKSTEEFNKTLAHTKDNLELFTENFQKGVLAMATEMAITARGMRHSIAALTRVASYSMNKLQKKTEASGEEIADTVSQLKKSSEELVSSVEMITENLDPNTGIPPKIKAALFSLRETCLSIEEGAQEILAFSENGAAYQDDLKTIMANTNRVLDRIDGTLTSVLGYVREEKKPRFEYNTSYEIILTGGSDKLKADLGANFYLSGDKNEFLYLGLTDINEPYSAVNVQVGKNFSEDLTLRAGLIKSAFGGGLDYKITDKTTFSADFFDFRTHNAFIDVKSRYSLSDNFELVLGLDDVLDKKEVKMGFGLKF